VPPLLSSLAISVQSPGTSAAHRAMPSPGPAPAPGVGSSPGRPVWHCRQDRCRL